MPHRTGGSRLVRFNIVPKDLLYFDLIKNKITVLNLDKDLLNKYAGTSWRDWGYILFEMLKEKHGAKFKPGSYNYVFEIIGDKKKELGIIKLLSKENESPEMDNTSNEVRSDIDKIQKQLSNFKSENFSTELLISITRQSYETQINFLNQEISRKDLLINKLELKIIDLENDLNDASDIINELKGQTGISQYITIAKEFLQLKAGNIKGIESLKDSDSSDIPPEIIEVLGIVNWQQVPPEVLIDIVKYLKIFIQKLPLKG